MTEDDYRHFVCVVAGENPEELMKRYDMGLTTEKHIVYKYADAAKIRKSYMALLEELLKNDEISDEERQETEEMLDFVKGDTDEDFFNDMTAKYEHDEVTGDAITNANPEGKWSFYTMGKIFSVPFILNNDETSFQARKEDIHWFRIHHYNTKMYDKVWELCMEGVEPQNDEEKKLWENMHNRTGYLEKFKTKKNYTESCTAFWGYAFLSQETGWVELEPNIDQFEWMNKYYERFIEPLPENTLLTIYECKK